MTGSSSPHSGAAVRIDRLRKTFGSVAAVDSISLDIPAGTFITLLGPSGSGKTTTLNLIAGFLMPDAGEIWFDATVVSLIPPHKRNIGMVFQNYALFPHMTVFDNVGFPLKMRTALSGAEAKKRILETLALVELTGFETRYPRQLSGGQQQRVAMARALVSHPSLLLMDEPLGALDKKLREQLQFEIKKIHRTIGTTFVYVTHDQTEALTMSDLIVVMNRGRIEQVGSPRALYETPVNAFVADFLGGANLLPGRVVAHDGALCDVTMVDGWTMRVPAGELAATVGADVNVLIRPEDIVAVQRDERREGFETTEATVTAVGYLGESLKVEAAAHGLNMAAKLSRVRGVAIEIGDRIYLAWPRESARLLLKDRR